MKTRLALTAFTMALLAFAGLAGACQPQTIVPRSLALRDVPIQAEVRWAGSYQKDIQPIFEEFCVSCHGPENPANGLRLDTYEGMMKGTQYGRVVIPGMPAGSTLLRIVQPGTQPQVHMPYGNFRLSPNRLQNLTLWIEAGAPRS